jgi:hypothetical protein
MKEYHIEVLKKIGNTTNNTDKKTEIKLKINIKNIDKITKKK